MLSKALAQEHFQFGSKNWKRVTCQRYRYNEIPPRVESTLTTKGQELVQSVVGILQWMRKWANSKKR